MPYEMKGIMEDAVIPLLKEKFSLPVIVHRTMLTAGIGESALAEIIKDFEDNITSWNKAGLFTYLWYGEVAFINNGG